MNNLILYNLFYLNLSIMEEKKIDSITNSYESNESMKLFFEKRNTIFEHIYNVLANNSNEEEENRKIQEIINQKNIEDVDKIQLIKKLKAKNYIKNLEQNYKPEHLQKYNLGLIVTSYPNTIKLVF